MPGSGKCLHDLDDPKRILELRALIQGKPALRLFYLEVYEKFRRCIKRSPPNGLILELGSGAGFAKESIPELITSDIIAYLGVDRVIDGAHLPFADASIRTICMLNVFHHLPDAESFLFEAARCLVPGGRIIMVDQHHGLLNRLIYAYFHHEDSDPAAAEWKFNSTGPLSSANAALAWIVFQRDQKKFEALFPSLQLEAYQPHTPLRYWLAGGLRPWSLLSPLTFRLLTGLEGLILKIWPGSACFVDVEIVKVEAKSPSGEIKTNHHG